MCSNGFLLVAKSKGHFDSADYERQLRDGVNDRADLVFFAASENRCLDTKIDNQRISRRPQRIQTLTACLFYPIPNRYPQTFYIFVGQVTTVHNHIPRTLHSIEDMLDPLLSLQQVLKVRPISYDYA
jgi:hypothetical protein